MDSKQLIEAARNYDFDITKISKDAEDRKAFTERWPIEKLDALTVEEYCGLFKNSFIYWLEFKKLLAGIGGGSAFKFGVYSKPQEKKYFKRDGMSGREISGNELESEFKDIRDQICLCLNLAEKGDISEIEKLEKKLSAIVLLKILTIYKPKNFITALSKPALAKAAVSLELLAEDEAEESSCIYLNFIVNKKLNEFPETKNWTDTQRGHFIWEHFKEEKNQDEETIWKNILTVGMYLSKYGDGHKNARFPDLSWKETYAMFYPVLGKKRELESFCNTLKNARDKFDGHNKSSRQGWKNPDGKPLSLTNGERKIFEKYSDMSEPKFWKKIVKLIDEAVEDDGGEEMTLSPDKAESRRFPLNQIFCGPPGTGKTYNSIFRALEILNITISGKKGTDEHRAEAIKEFESQIKKGNILFLTFNQSYSYEEFIEGIRPVLNKDQLTYKLENGILKKFVQDDSKIEYLFSVGEILKATRAKYIVERVDNGNIKLRKYDEAGSDSRGNIYIPIEALEELWNFLNTKKITPDVLMSRDYLQSIKQDLETDNFILSYTSEFTACLNHLMLKRDLSAHEKSAKVLLIDEINRGNVSQIFGELITLLEEDKRDGKGVPVSLPYSKHSFILPANLYILGTMNTADKSIAPLDFALRRRFNFESFWPNPSLVAEKWNVDGVSKEQAQSVFESLNHKIEMLKGKDYTVGHSYFLKLNSSHDLYKTMFEQVIPLLNEYFYHDWNSLKFVLGSSFITKHPAMKKFRNITNLVDECWLISDFVEGSEINIDKFLKAFIEIAKTQANENDTEEAS
jgi:hypothetical protein